MKKLIVCAAIALALAAGCGQPPPHQLSEARYENRGLPGGAPADDPHFAAAQAAREALPRETTLPAVVTLAALNNPMTSAAWYRLSAAQELRPQRTALPDPKLEAQYFFQRGDSNYMLMLSQEIPFPTKLLIEGDRADRETAIAALRYDAAVRDAIADAKVSYYELYYIDRAQTVTAALTRLYARYAALAAGNPAGGADNGPMAMPAPMPPPAPAPMPDPAGETPMNGAAPMPNPSAPSAPSAPAPAPALPELFRAQSQLAQARYDLALLAEMRAAQSQQLIATLGLDPTADIGPTADLPAPPPLGLTLADLRTRAAGHSQELAILQLEKERADLALDAARQAPIPDLMVGVTYADMKMLPTNKDPIGLSVGLSLPLWWGKYSAMQREADRMSRAMAAEQRGAALMLNADLAQLWFRLQNADRLVRLYQNTLLPQARQALRSAEEQHRQGNLGLLAVLEATATVHNFELAHLRATADFYQQLARLEQKVGAPIVPAPAPPPASEPPANRQPEVHP